MAMMEMLARGGPIMWPLAACSLLALTVVLERLSWRWRQRRLCDAAGVDRLLERAEVGAFEAALVLAKASHDPAAAVLAAGLRQRDVDAAAAMQDAAQDQLDAAARGLGVLDTVVTVAPLLGILGTVTGIIGSFDMLGQAGVQQPQAVVGGIAEALLTTATGLVIAVLTLLPLNGLNSAVRRDARRLEKLGTRLELAIKRSVRQEAQPCA